MKTSKSRSSIVVTVAIVLGMLVIVILFIAYWGIASTPITIYSYGKTTALSNTTGSSSDPQIAATEKGDVYVVWRDETTGNGDIYFRKSTDYGDTFKNTKNLRGNNGSSSDPQIVSSNDSVAILWNESKNNNTEIHFQTIQGDASSFDNSTNLSENHLVSYSPHIFATGNNINVVWIDKVNSKNSYVEFKHINKEYLGGNNAARS